MDEGGIAFLDLVKEPQPVGCLRRGLSEPAGIALPAAQQGCHYLGGLELRAVKPHEGRGAEQLSGQEPGGLGLAHAGRPGEEQRPATAGLRVRRQRVG